MTVSAIDARIWQVGRPHQPVFTRQSAGPVTRAAYLLVALVYLRWLAGVVENFGVPAISEVTAVTMLGFAGIIFLVSMRVAGDGAVFVAGIIAWVIVGLLSLGANNVPAPQQSLALLMLLILYGLMLNAMFLYLRDTVLFTILRRFLTFFIVVGVALSALQIVTQSGFVEAGRLDQQRAFGSDVHPVSFAIQMLAALVAFEALRVRSGRRFTIYHATILCAGAVAIYLTQARTVWVMALITLAITVLARANWLTRVGFVLITLPLCPATITLSDRFSDLASLSAFWENFSIHDIVFDFRYIDNSVSWRIVNWAYGFQQALEQPILGFGPGQSASASQFSLEMHNIFLETFFEGGIIGLSAFLLLLIGLFRIHCALPRLTPAEKYSTTLVNGFGTALLLAVTFSTSFVDQLMSFLIYGVALCVAGTRSELEQAPIAGTDQALP